MSASRPIASDLSYFVLQKQRRDPEVALSPRHQSHQVGQSIRINRRLWDLDQAVPEDQFIGSRDETPIGHRPRKRG